MKAILRTMLALSGLLVLGVFFYRPVDRHSGDEPSSAPATLLAGEPAFEQSAEQDPAPSMLDGPDWGSGDASLEPVNVDDVDEFNLGFYTDIGFYLDDQGRYVVDLLEQDYAYLTVIITDNDGRAVVGATPEFEIKGSSTLLRPEEVGSRTATDASGSLDFAIIGGAMGLDEVRVKIGESVGEMAVNVISLRATGFPVPPEIEGGLAWSDLMSARVRFDEAGMSVEFPEAVRSRANTQVRLSGFIMPLDPDIEQRHFLLTSNPPSCFFHIPGGPAGAVEVFAAEGIAANWDPVVLEGRLETLDRGDYGVIYRLQDARAIEP
jgi:hypothetical protein